MNNNKLLLTISLLLFLFGCNSTTDSGIAQSDNLNADYFDFSTLQKALPATSASDQIIEHYAYILNYNEEYEQANWVIYCLLKEHLNGAQSRTDNFREDPNVSTKSATLGDYRNSGYDRGHLAPAGDMTWSYQAMSESFFLSNMSPQTPGFNRGIWNTLESYVRNWASENNEIYVVTGPVLYENLQVIGESSVAIPEFFYKVILDYTGPSYKGIGFILRNESSQDPLQNYAVSIDSVEAFVGIDFFPAIPDTLENIIESTLDLAAWTFSSYSDDNLDSTDNAIEDSNQSDNTPNSGIIVYITETGSKYHTATCRYLSSSKIPISLEDAKSQGYSPCSVCNPPE